MSDHHINGPSALIRRRACPGSMREEMAFAGDEVESDDAIAGTKRHAAAAAGLREQHRRAEILADLPAEDADLVSAWWSYWDAKVLLAQEGAQPGTQILGGVEDKVELPAGRFGSVDCWMSYVHRDGHEVLIVADLKGQPPGRAGSNLQLADYVRGVAAKLGDAGRERHVIVALVSRAGIDEVAYSADQHAKLIADIDAVLAACSQPDAPCRPSPHCGYCRAAATCSARQAVAAEAAAMLPTMADVVDTMRSLAPEQRTEMADKIALAIDRLTEAQDLLKGAIRDGTIEIPGYRVQPTSQTAWRDAAAAKDAIIAAATTKGVPLDDLFPLVSASKAASILGKSAVEPLTEKRTGTPQVKRVK